MKGWQSVEISVAGEITWGPLINEIEGMVG